MVIRTGGIMVEELEPEVLIISVDSERCIGCFECIDICPQSTNAEFPVYVRGDDGFPRVANPDSCIACFSCVVSCRAMAIKVEGPLVKGPSIVGEVKAESKSRAMF
jgi:NAD-dependent dihydropyrimidine dehydrogenase PreA subunit